MRDNKRIEASDLGWSGRAPGEAKSYDGPGKGYDGPSGGYDGSSDSYDGPGDGYDRSRDRSATETPETRSS